MNSKKNRKNFMQWIASLTTFLLIMQYGINLGWSSPNIARLSDNNSKILLTKNEISWVASCDSLGGTFGALLGPMSVEFFGPKQTGLIAFILYSLTWICIFIADYNFIWLIAGRFVGGISNVSSAICVAIYLGEVSNSEIRGTLISVAFSGTVTGVIFGVLLETFLHTKITCPIYLTLCLIGILILTFVLPESPYYLLKSNDTVKTRRSITLFFPNEVVDEKLSDIKDYVLNKKKFLKTQKKSLLRLASTRRLFIFIIILSGLIECSGLVTMERFNEVILRRAGLFAIDPQIVVILSNVFVFITRLMTCNVIDKFGRKILLVITSILSSFILLSLGLYFYVLHLSVNISKFHLLPIVFIFIFKCSYSIGFYTGLYTLLSELFPPSIKNLANCSAHLSTSFFGFVLSRIFLPLSDSLGEEYLFWINAICAFLVTPFIIFLLPETKGKSLKEMHSSNTDRKTII